MGRQIEITSYYTDVDGVQHGPMEIFDEAEVPIQFEDERAKAPNPVDTTVAWLFENGYARWVDEPIAPLPQEDPDWEANTEAAAIANSEAPAV